MAAALLKRDGYRVVGVYMKNWTKAVGGIDCPWKEDLADARSAAAAIGIPFKVYDFENEYCGRVVDYLVREYAAGRTPNPDVMCNQEIKFKLFLETALAEGADLIATGHYARVHDDRLFAGADPDKDQSYFLCRVSTEALRKTLMPLGELKKSRVRELAREFGLPTADKPDSQGICFVGEVGIRDFLREYIDAKPGPIVAGGKVIGTHQGAALYTIGQRHGLGLGGGRPFYVTAVDVDSNTITVTDDQADLTLQSSSFRVSSLNWINRPEESDEVSVRVRYRGELTPCRFEEDGREVTVKTAEPIRAVAAGQAAVFYRGGELLGGGLIDRVFVQSSRNVVAQA